jgi:hypothetical protein
MDILQITKENALLAYEQGTTNQKEMLVRLFGNIFYKNIFERVTSFEDACSVLGVCVSDILSRNDTKDEIAYKKLKRIAEALNEGWKPDWEDGNQYKYTLRGYDFDGVGFSDVDYRSWLNLTTVSSRLCFKSREVVEYVIKTFPGLIQDYLTY